MLQQDLRRLTVWRPKEAEDNRIQRRFCRSRGKEAWREGPLAEGWVGKT